jgi:hypothetical protein
MVESARLALASSGCKPEALLLSYDPEMKIGLVRGWFGMLDGQSFWIGWVVVGSHHVLLLFRQALSLD